jgi:hypothetical protein
VISVARVINGTSKGIENATVDMFPLGRHQTLVQVLRIPSLQVADPMNSDIIEQKGNFWANARDGCKTFRFHHPVVLKLELTGFHKAQRNEKPVQRFDGHSFKAALSSNARNFQP